MRCIVEEVWKMWVDLAKELLWYTGGKLRPKGMIELKDILRSSSLKKGNQVRTQMITLVARSRGSNSLEEVEEEEEDVELPLPTMGVPPLEENDAPYPDPWIGVMDMDVTYRNTMVPVDDDNVPPPAAIESVRGL
ncbi:hypothetical protein H6P81_017993 [Aristolochia fimbriata]|uniref:Uncharacterized protein n=1 Tax=Aristolochia fimbriata TaxID=158543 RepID=A0AAV7E108_ARIFI|nr:hypothetical protein H6P81_017993 [Aristolochia fimbriata]